MSARDTTPAETVEHLAEQAVQIRHVTADFRARELPLHESNTGSFYRFKKALESLEHRHGNMGIRGQAPFDLRSIFLGKPCLSPIPFPNSITESRLFAGIASDVLLRHHLVRLVPFDCAFATL